MFDYLSCKERGEEVLLGWQSDANFAITVQYQERSDSLEMWYSIHRIMFRGGRGLCSGILFYISELRFHWTINMCYRYFQPMETYQNALTAGRAANKHAGINLSNWFAGNANRGSHGIYRSSDKASSNRPFLPHSSHCPPISPSGSTHSPLLQEEIIIALPAIQIQTSKRNECLCPIY